MKENKNQDTVRARGLPSKETATGIDYSKKCPGMTVYSPYSGRKKLND